jgi:hypothetical protein
MSVEMKPMSSPLPPSTCLHAQWMPAHARASGARAAGLHGLRVSLLALALTTLSGCDMLGIESASQIAARKEAEGRAIGGACRHAGRAIEECYSMNRRADKAAIFAGWREMNDYMIENKMDEVAPRPAEDVAASGVDARAPASPR